MGNDTPVAWGKFAKVAMKDNPCFGCKRLAASYCNHVAAKLCFLSRLNIPFVNYTVVTPKSRKVSSFAASGCPLSCLCEHLSLCTCRCCCCCNNHVFKQQVVFIVTSTYFLVVVVGFQRSSTWMRRTFVLP